MTDSMKFGPEWLRNMSADNTNINLTSSASNAGISSSLTNSGSSSNNGNACSHPSFGMASYVPSQQSYNSGPRNTFPEFRYGREEMLSLFDKYYNIPEILPKFKKIFVEKVQLPLALTPSTEEELLSHTPHHPNQRSSWIQRSPVGFSNPTRGSGRGSSVDRGRMRGKSNYHQIYQRPTALFDEDDSRSSQLKIDRGWSDRNGTVESLNVSGASMCGFGLHTDWNDTPNSSPRKEFSSHPRNMENWRRNRSEDGSGDSLTNCLGNPEGWRGSNNMGTNITGNHRWGRSTSWRDEDTQSGNINDAGYGSAIAMQRSYSTITTVNERGTTGITASGSITKNPPNTYSGITNHIQSRTLSFVPILNSPSVRKAQWNANVGTGNNSGAESEDILPEWAMEYPSDGGGTFDASGAFHRSAEENENSKIDSHSEGKNSFEEENLIHNNKACSLRDKKYEDSTEGADALVEAHLTKKNSILCTTIEVSIELPRESVEKSHLNTSSTNLVHIIEDEKGTNQMSLIKLNEESKLKTSTKDVVLQPTAISPNTVCYKPADGNLLQEGTDNVQRDLSDRMQKVADDMIEKLIMDDDAIITKDNNIRSKMILEHRMQSATMGKPTQVGTHLDDNNVIMTVSAVLNPQIPVVQGPTSISPTLASTIGNDGVHKGIRLYGGGLAIDYATMHHHNMKQQQLTAASVTPIGNLSHGIHPASLTAAETDLWYYRDPQSKVQGPFTAIEMTEWYRAGYFNENLFVRRLCDTHFRSLGELIKLCSDNMPFTHSQLLQNLDNLDLLDTAVASAKQLRNPLTVAGYSLEQQSHQQLEQSDHLAGSPCVETDFLGNGGKGHMVPVNVSSMYFQMMPHQEILVYNELSANECFQQLAPTEKEAVLLQKLQLRADYLRNLSVVNNSLASMSSSVGTNTFGVMIDDSKKDNIFSKVVHADSSKATQLSETTTYLDAESFQMKSPPPKEAMPTVFSRSSFGTIMPPGETTKSGKFDGANDDPVGNEFVDSLGMRTLMSTGNTNPPINPSPIEFVRDPCGGFLNDAEFIMDRSSLDQSNLHGSSWLSQVVNRQPMASHQSPREWSNNMLAGIPIPAVSSLSCATVDINLPLESPQKQKITQKQKLSSTDLWKLSMLEHPQSDKITQETPLKNTTNSETISLAIQKISPKGEQVSVFDETTLQSRDSNICNTEKKLDITVDSKQDNSVMVSMSATNTGINKFEDEYADKHQNVNTKRVIKLQPLSNKDSKEFDDSGKKSLGDRRRDQEDKRRHREEKKRQLADEEKRRRQKTDEDKRSQMTEEKEHQQIQGQRRKAVIGGAALRSTNSPARDQQRVQSSVAPWSSQINVSATGGPSLAEIQKAERRERQMEQRQVETLVKRVRTGAVGAVEVYDPMLKWNAPLKEVPVKSFAEIQAEEARRLADEHSEIQRRKEQEQHVVAAMTTTSNSRISNMSAIWSGTKVWGQTNATGFWEEPTKFSTDIASNSSAIEADSNSSKCSSSCSHNPNNLYKQAVTVQHKLPQSIGSTLPTTGHISKQSQDPNQRSLRKSQTLPVIPNAGQQTGKASKYNQQHSNPSKQGSYNQPHQNNGVNNIDGGPGTEKRSASRNQCNYATGCRTSTNKKDDYESEFIVWCTKSLSNMNTKLDVPTFVTFLRDLESPYEVKDYIRMYLGENKESSDFGKQFLERRSTYKNLQRAQNAHNDDMCKPAPAITPSHINDNCDYKGKQRKVKKSKMTKLDARILGFSVTAAEGRTNVGDRVYVDAP